MENTLNNVAFACFILAILHTFSVKLFQQLAHKYPEGSVPENFFHLLGEVEVVFGIWALILMSLFAIMMGRHESIVYLEKLNFTEPLFVFVIMVVSATKPLIKFADKLIHFFSKLLPINKTIAFYIATLVIGPLLGSFITEPAAMTVTALILSNYFYKHKISMELKYATLGLLFVNVSIGGAMTPYAAPPILMVAGTWGWDLAYVFSHFGIESIISTLISTFGVAIYFRKELSHFNLKKEKDNEMIIPWWVTLTHLIFLALVVMNAHHSVVFISLFMFFIGFTTVTKEYQTELKIKEGLLVSFFLGGLVVLGSFQSFWLTPLLQKLNSIALFLGSIGLTAITDNAALTYLGSQVPGLSDELKLALVSGAIIGGGLTVIANAPNPAGYGILNPSFGEEGISPWGLFKAAIIPTIVAATIFYLSRTII